MKKLIVLFLVLTLAMGFTACSSKEETVEETTEETVEEIVNTEEELEEVLEDTTLEEIMNDPISDTAIQLPMITEDGEIIYPEEDSALEMEAEAETETEAESATATLQVLQNIWGMYADEEKFAIMGGNPEAGVMDAPGSYDMTYAENLSFNLLIPAEQLANVDEAATMIHMMNANTFTGGVVHLTEGTDAAAFAQAMRDAIQNNQWICGFPEKLIVADMGNGCVLVAFGVNDTMTVFEANLTEAYADAQLLFNEAIAG